jgi:DNA-directed RNA polymerase subunit M/transcription elongation factor TFIIS
VAKSPDERLETKYILDLKKQIQRLKKENQQLRRMNQKLDNDFIDSQIDLEMEGIEVSQASKNSTTKAENRIECPKCGAYEVITFMLRNLPYYKCMSCDSRGKIKQGDEG